MQCEKITSRIGARVRGIDLTRPLAPADVAAIRAALDEHQVLFFIGQKKLTGEQHLGFARNFGEIPENPFSTSASTTKGVTTLDFTDPKLSNTDAWHSDGSFHAKPPAGSILQAQSLPVVGGLMDEPTKEKVLLALEPRVVMAAMHTTMIRASMTAYSTAVGPSSFFRNDTIFFVSVRIGILQGVWSTTVDARI